MAHLRTGYLLRYPLPWSIAPIPGDQIWMKKMREQLNSFDDAWAWPGKVCICIDSVHLDVLSARHPPREFRGALESVAARRHDDRLRLRAQDVIPLHANRIFAGSTQWIVAAGERNHLGHPVPAAEQWIRPLQKNHSTIRCASDLFSQRCQSFAIGAHEAGSFPSAANRSSHSEDILLYLADSSRSEKQNFRLQIEFSHGARELVS